MRKKFLVALAASLIIANGSSVALATGGSDDSTTTSTTVPRTQVNPNLSDSQQAAQRAAQQAQQAAQRADQLAQQAAQRAAQQAQQAAQRDQREADVKYRIELAKYQRAHKLIEREYATAFVNAGRISKVALNSATTLRERNMARQAFINAVRAATEAKNAALRALGEPPEKPVKP